MFIKETSLCACVYLHVQSVTKLGLTERDPMSTAICGLCFKFQIQKGTLGTKLAKRFISFSKVKSDNFRTLNFSEI